MATHHSAEYQDSALKLAAAMSQVIDATLAGDLLNIWESDSIDFQLRSNHATIEDLIEGGY